MMPPLLPDHASVSILSRQRASLAKLWRLDGLEERVAETWPTKNAGRATKLFWRIRLVATPIYLAALALVPIALVGYLVWPSKQLSFMLLTLGMVCMVAQAVTQAARLWLLLAIGGWSGKNGTKVLRAERPVPYWANVVAHTLAVCVCIGAAGYLVLSVVEFGARLGR